MLATRPFSFFNPIERRSTMEQELFYDERDYDAANMDYYAVIDDDEDQEVYEHDQENN